MLSQPLFSVTKLHEVLHFKSSAINIHNIAGWDGTKLRKLCSAMLVHCNLTFFCKYTLYNLSKLCLLSCNTTNNSNNNNNTKKTTTVKYFVVKRGSYRWDVNHVCTHTKCMWDFFQFVVCHSCLMFHNNRVEVQHHAF